MGSPDRDRLLTKAVALGAEADVEREQFQAAYRIIQATPQPNHRGACALYQWARLERLAAGCPPVDLLEASPAILDRLTAERVAAHLPPHRSP